MQLWPIIISHRTAHHNPWPTSIPIWWEQMSKPAQRQRQLISSGQALASDPGNDDLAALAVVGAVAICRLWPAASSSPEPPHPGYRLKKRGDRHCRDIKLFGRQTRPVYKMLEYSQDPYLPGLSGKEDACIDFLKEIGIRLGGERWRRWIDLSQEEKAAVVTAIIQKGMRSGISNTRLERLIGEVYILLKEREGTELKDASEYSTLLNATARYGHASVGLKVSMGDREKALDQARALLGQHRQNLVAGLKLVAERGITPLKSIQYFDAGDAILDTIIGIVAGMSFQMADRSRPILAFAQNEEGDLKVSAREPRIWFAPAWIGSALSSPPGLWVDGGGHNVAAGATIPQKAKEEFLQMMDSIISEQLSGKNEYKNRYPGAGQ